MRLFISGSAPLSAETHRQFAARTGHVILERYGMTETNMNTSNPYDGERLPGSVGLPLPGTELRIADPVTGRDLAEAGPGTVGVIEVRGSRPRRSSGRMGFSLRVIWAIAIPEATCSSRVERRIW